MRTTAVIGGWVLALGFAVWILLSLVTLLASAAGAMTAGRALVGLLILGALAAAVWWFIRDLRENG